ncbi:MAG TPA: fatty-acid--CoA ligase FadD4, partial [Mycobacterium sp.]|nr:fatty-acid--CoA ligase FadD4 [Mycobacterium sp.]
MQIREHAEVTPDKPAVIMHPAGTVVTFGELEARANRLAHHFRQAGLVEGDTVAILMENNEHFHTTMWAARRSGLYYVPINTHLTAAEAAYIIDNSNAKGIIGSAALRTTLDGLAAELPRGLPELLLVADGAESSATSASGDLDGWQRYPECVAGHPDTPITDEIEGDLLQYSSGTTGRPKGIKRELPHLPPAEAPGLMTMLVSVWMQPDSVYLSPAPLYHTAPSVWSMTVQAAGYTTVVMQKFDPEGALDAIQRYGVTHGQFVPVMFTRMLKLPEIVRNSYDVSSLKRVIHAAAPCPVEIKKQMIDWWGPIIDEYYASSEAHGSTLIAAEDWLAHPGSVGKPMVGALHILDEDGNELPPGEPGEIYFEGGNTFEYLNDPEKTAKSRDKHGWMTVGDIGYVDEEGYLYLTDRRHHMIISGGVNIYPQEAENMLVVHPKVLDAAVFGVPDEEMGQSVKAVVQTVDPADATAEFGDEL